MKTGTLVLAAVVLFGGALGARGSYVTEVVGQMPARNTVEEGPLAAKLMAGGAPAVKEVCGMLVPLGTAGKDDTAARYTIGVLVRHAGRPNGENDREALVKGICDTLAGDVDVEVRTFLINRLQEVGHDDAIATLSGALLDANLGPHAAAALERVGSRAAGEALGKALPSASGAGRVAIVKALGALRSTSAIGEIHKSATDDDKVLRMTALWALANLGDDEALGLIERAIATTAGEFDKSRLVAWRLLWAKRQLEAGNQADAAWQCQETLNPERGYPASARSAAARLLMEISPSAAEVVLLHAERGDVQFRAAAVDAVARVPGEKATAALVATLKSQQAEMRAEVLDALGRRRDAAARPAVVEALTDPDVSVRLAALRAAVALGAAEAVAPLLERVATDTDEVARAAAELVARMPGDRALAAAADAMAGAPAKAKVILLEVLAARGAVGQKTAVLGQATAADAPVRLAALRAMEKLAGEADAARLVEIAVAAKDEGEAAAALKAAAAGAAKNADGERRADAFVAALATAKGARRAAIERAAARVGGAKALAVVVADLKSDDAATRDGALGALADWQDDAALAPLLDVAQADGAEAQQVTALRGAVAVLRNSKSPAAEKAKAYGRAMAAAKRPEEKRMILGALGNERGRQLFDVATAALDAEGLKAEAALAVIKIATPQPKGVAGLKGAEVAGALKRAIPECPDPTLKADAERYLKTLAK